MIYHGREVDVASLWSEFVDLPNDVDRHLGTFLPKTKCPNPKHTTDKRHFQINSAKPFVHCFARCGISGTYEHAIATIKGCTEKEARALIFKHTRIPLGGLKDHVSFSGTRKRVDGPDEIANDERSFRAGNFSFLPVVAHNYLDSRGISPQAVFKWDIGYDEETSRITIPAMDDRQAFRFLIRRATGHEQPKYLYTPGAIKSAILFGTCYLDRSVLASTGLVLVEGSLDTIRLHEHGVGSALGTLGSGLSRKQVRLIDSLRPRRVYCFFDRDSSGVDNIMDAREKLGKHSLFVCLYPGEKEDPAELTHDEVWRALERAVPIGKFYRNVMTLTRRK